MKILMPFRPDIHGERVVEFSTVAMGMHLGNHLMQHGHQVGYVTSIGRDRFFPGSWVYPVHQTTAELHGMAESFLIYREHEYDVLHVHTANFATFKQLSKYVMAGDRVVCTIHIPANIGRSFWYHKDDLLNLLEFPNFRLVCVSRSGSYIPTMHALGYSHLIDPLNPIPYAVDSPPGRVRVVPNGIIDLGIHPVPVDQKVDRFMFVAHFMPSKNVVHTLQMAVESRIPCLFVGRRLPHKHLSANEEAYAMQCEELINNNRDIIEYHPVVPYRDCVQMMAHSKCLVVLSDVESFGFTPVEAAQVGTPTIWLACQGIDETMEDGETGFRINRREYKNWKKRRGRAAELFRNVEILDQNAMAARVRSRYSMGACTHGYEAIYRELLEGVSAVQAA